MAEYTIVKQSNGEYAHCTGGHCRRNYSVKEFYGFCETCWIALKPEERAALKGEELPVVNVQVHREGAITWASFFGLIWKLAVTAAVGYLFYAGGYLNRWL